MRVTTYVYSDWLESSRKADPLNPDYRVACGSLVDFLCSHCVWAFGGDNLRDDLEPWYLSYSPGASGGIDVSQVHTIDAVVVTCPMDREYHAMFSDPLRCYLILSGRWCWATRWPALLEASLRYMRVTGWPAARLPLIVEREILRALPNGAQVIPATL